MIVSINCCHQQPNERKIMTDFEQYLIVLDDIDLLLAKAKKIFDRCFEVVDDKGNMRMMHEHPVKKYPGITTSIKRVEVGGYLETRTLIYKRIK